MTNYISNLRNLATISVILLHAAALYVSNFNGVDLTSWKIANFIDSSVRFCVPIFLMISGALLLNKEENLQTFINKRLKRVIIPFIFWNIIYFLYDNYNLEISTLDFIKRFIASFLNGSSYHFWYIYLIIGIYLFIPILRKWTISASKNEIQYFLILWIITLFINNYTIKYFPKIELMYFSKYIGYLVLGHYINTYIKEKKMISLGYLSFTIGILLTYYLTSYFSIKNNSFFSFFYEYLSPNVALASVGIFLIIKNINLKPNSTLLKLDSLSYGIYLIHIIVLNNILDILKPYKINVLTNILLLTISTYFFSLVIIYLLSKIKFLKNIVT